MKIKILISSFCITMISGCVANPIYVAKDATVANPNPSASLAVESTLTGTASYYADKFHGKKTANGEIYDMNGFTAAHKTLPFGTIVDVTNLANNKKIRLRITDRGPFVGDRIIDVTLAAAKELDMLKTGTAEVRIDILKK